MYACNVLAVSGALVAAAAAVPHQHRHRDIVWETVVDEVIVTVPVTKTIWIEPGETAPTEPSPEVYHAPLSTAQAEPAAYTPSSSAASPPAYTSLASSSSSIYVASPPAYTPPESSSSFSAYVAPSSAYTQPKSSTTSVYVAPTPSFTSVYVAPTPESTYVAPVPSSSYVAPAESSPAPSNSGSSSSSEAITYGICQSGQSFTGDLTNFAPGLGACGFTNTTDQAIVAVSHVIWDSYEGENPNDNPLCKKWITIKGQDGQDHPAQIVDKCPGCAAADLDLTLSLFLNVTNADGRAHGMTWTMD